MTEGLTPVVDATEEPKKDTSKEWTLDAAARKRIDAAYAEIEAEQSGYPKCAVCGERTRALDKFGCCPRTTEIHRQHRNEFRSVSAR